MTIRTVALSALSLLVAFALAGMAYGGPGFALGVLASGLVMLGSLGLGALLVDRAAATGSVGASLLITFKLPLVGIAVWLLLQRFPPLAVVAGGSVLVTAILLLSITRGRAASSEA